MSSPAFTANPPTVQAAIRLIRTSTQPDGHHFWNDNIRLSEVGVRWRERLGPKQITDAYLLMLAIHHKGKLVTFDRRMLALAPEGSEERDSLELLT
jgi:predicted nucleic acid-binding protein